MLPIPFSRIDRSLILAIGCTLVISSCATAHNSTTGRAADDYYSPQVLKMENAVYSPTIHTVQLFKKGFELAPPLIQLNSDESLILRFDDLQQYTENLSYTVIHCDANWEQSDLMSGQYLTGTMNDYIPAGRQSFNTLQQFIEYEVEVPNGMMQFTRSGNYLLKVYRDSDEEDLVLTRRFMVFEQIVDIEARVVASRNVELRDQAQQVDLTIRTASLPIQDPFSDIHVAMMQNMRWDDLRTGFKPRFVRDRELVYDFPEPGLFMGNNEYRNYDLKNMRFMTPRIASIDPGPGQGVYEVKLVSEIKRNIRVYFEQPDLNGRYLIKNDLVNDDPLGADYAGIHFSMPMAAPMMEDVYAYGAFSDFKCQQPYRMTWNPESKAYELRALLKQGFYDFMFVTLPKNSSVPDLTAIEGSHFQTENDYVTLVYFTDRLQRCDRLVGVKFVNSRRG
ncbi:MAG: DUF5103 domain-containing protein [Flavobacteriales bacterium]|nr:DUF5103 domain-containing protein [Flavobacteriales bacterium]